MRHPDGSTRGFGFITFTDEASVEKCLVVEHTLGGRRVDAKRAMSREESGRGAGAGAGAGGLPALAPWQQGGAGGAAGGAQHDRTVDWVCEECGNSNPGWRHTCQRCGARCSPPPLCLPLFSRRRRRCCC